MNRYTIEKLEKIYSKLPKINCKKLCADSCGMIVVGEEEEKRITEFLGENPFLRNADIQKNLESGCLATCSLLKDRKCSVYRLRPLICRLFGLTKKMACPFGCVPEKWLDDETAKKFLKKLKYFKHF